MRSKNFIKSIICLIMAAALTIPACPARTRAAETTGTEKKNEAVSSTADAIMTADQSAPAEYEEYSEIEVYGNKDTSFLLSEQNELFFYRTTAENKDGKNYKANGWSFYNADMTLKTIDSEKNYYFVDSINNYNSNEGHKEYKVSFKEQNDKIIANNKGYSYVQGVGFDPLGEGRKRYAGYIGWYDGYLYCFVVNPQNGTTWSIKLNSMSWVKEANPEYYEAVNFMSITAGDYDGDHKDSLLVFGCGDGSDLGIYEVTFNGKKLSSKKIINLASAKTSSGEPILYRDNYKLTKNYLRNKVQVTLTTGDFDGDDIDEYAFTAGYSNPSDGAKNGYSGKADHIEAFATTVGIVDFSNSQWTAPVGFYMYDRVKKVEQKNTVEKWRMQVMNGGSLTAADTDGDGVDEIVVAGYTSINDTFAWFNVSGDTYTLKEVSHMYDMHETKFVTSVISLSEEAEGIAFVRSDLELIAMKKLQQNCIYNKQNEAYVFPHISMASAKTNGKNAPEDVFIAGTIYSFEGDKSDEKFTPKIIDEKFSKVMDKGSKTYVFWVNNVTAGNFDHNDAGREQFVYTLWFKQSGDPLYYSYLGIVGGAKYGDSKDKVTGAITSYGTVEQYGGNDLKSGWADVLWSKTGNASGALSKSASKYCNAVPVTVDLNDDGILAKYNSAKYIYSDPEVVTVLVATPQFEECQEAGDISYTLSTEIGRSKSSGWEVAFNVGYSGEYEFGPAKLAVEAGVNNSFSKTYTNSYSIEESSTVTASGTTSVIVRRIPLMVYVYDVYDSAKKKWLTASHAVTVPLTPAYYSLDVDEYNDFVREYNESLNTVVSTASTDIHKISDSEYNKLAKAYNAGVAGTKKPYALLLIVRGKDIPSVDGDPFVYESEKISGKKSLLSSKITRDLGTNGGSTGLSWTYTEGKEEEYTHTHGFYVSATLSAGWNVTSIAGAWTGINVGIETTWSFSQVKSTSYGQSVEAEVPNLNKKELTGIFTPDQIAAYKFKWGLATWSRNLNGDSSAPVKFYGYTVSNVTAPVAGVSDLTAEMSSDDAGKRFVKLSWTNPATDKRPVDNFTIYRVTEEEVKNGKKTEKQTIKTEIATVSDTEFDFRGVDKTPSYSFIVVSNHVVEHDGGTTETLHSPESNLATASFQDKMIYDIVKKGEGEENDGKTDKEKTDENGLIIYYNDGTSKEIDNTNGKSAYDIAVEHGFKGTEEEWLESLKGKDGEKGADGSDGSSGASAFDIARRTGQTNAANETDWIASLGGGAGLSIEPYIPVGGTTVCGFVLVFPDGSRFTFCDDYLMYVAADGTVIFASEFAPVNNP